MSPTVPRTIIKTLAAFKDSVSIYSYTVAAVKVA